MSFPSFLLLVGGLAAAVVASTCEPFEQHAVSTHPPLSGGRFQLAYQRPDPECRTSSFPEVERTIDEMKVLVKDPDLFRLFENSFPNTLDTTITWKGAGADDAEEELTFITTGDINAMWLRDSANQLQSYKSLLKHDSSANSLASLFRGAINLQARYIRESPHCNAFQPPRESNITTVSNMWSTGDLVYPSFSSSEVFECKYELDSVAAFLQLSHDYYNATGDKDFFAKFKWAETVETIMNFTAELQDGTYKADGSVNTSPVRFERDTTSASETLSNHGAGAPVKGGTGLVRSFFRPSDDACIYQLFIPANMMYSSYLATCADIMDPINATLAQRMRDVSGDIRDGIENYGRMNHSIYGVTYSYEVDGFGGHNTMDDANIPSLLSAPMLGYVSRSDPIYQSTRKLVLSTSNPYYMRGPVINAVGGPHVGPGKAWPMALIVQILTSDDDAEIGDALRQLVSSTSQLGLIHETIDSHNAAIWTRPWFSWANGLFGQMLLDLRDRKPHMLGWSYQ